MRPSQRRRHPAGISSIYVRQSQGGKGARHIMTDPVLSEEPVPLLAETALVSHAAFLAASGRPFDEVVAGATEGLQCLWPGAKGLGFLFVDEIGRMLRPHPSCRGLSPDDLEPAPSDQAPVEAPIG